MKPKKLLGVETPGDKMVHITQREWDAVKLMLWRNKTAWETVAREAGDILASCEHEKDCPALEDETAACLFNRPVSATGNLTENVSTVAGCRDHEKRLSALVILNAARQFAPIDAKKLADGPYWAPSREYFSGVIAALVAAQAEIEQLRTNAPVATKELP